MKLISKTYTHANVVILKATIERDDVLIGYDMLGYPMYSVQTVHMTFYGVTIHECDRQLSRELNRPKHFKTSNKYERSLKFI